MRQRNFFFQWGLAFLILGWFAFFPSHQSLANEPLQLHLVLQESSWLEKPYDIRALLESKLNELFSLTSQSHVSDVIISVHYQEEQTGPYCGHQGVFGMPTECPDPIGYGTRIHFTAEGKMNITGAITSFTEGIDFYIDTPSTFEWSGGGNTYMRDLAVEEMLVYPDIQDFPSFVVDEVVGKIGEAGPTTTRRMVHFLIAYMNRQEIGSVRTNLVSKVETIGQTVIVPLMEAMEKSRNELFRRRAVEILGNIGNAGVVTYLTEISTNDSDPTIREGAKRALLKIRARIGA